MRVVHLLHYFPPEFRGGTEACVETLARAQVERGDEPIIVCGSDERSDTGEIVAETYEGLAVHRVRRRLGENYSVDHRLPRVAEQIVAWVDGLAPDVVHLHHTLNLSGDLARRLTRAGHVVVATLHDFTMVCARFFLVRPDGDSCAGSFPLPSERCVGCVLPDFPGGEALLRTELEARGVTGRAEAAALSVALAPSLVVERRWLASGLFEAGQLEWLPHAVPLAGTEPPPPRRRDDGRLVLATWGHLAPAKGLLDLLEALRIAGDERLALIVLGEATDEVHDAQLRRAAEGLEVRFGGRYARDDLPGLRGEADLAVFPSRAEETFGLVVAEARALGFPVLVSDRGALPEGIGHAGEALPAADPQAWAMRLKALAADADTVERWGAAARRDPPLGPRAHAERVADVYARAVGSPSDR